MTFSRPDILLLLWALPILGALCWYGLGRKRRILSEFGSGEVLKSLSPGISRTRDTVRTLLVLAVFSLVVIGLAGPKYGFQWREVHRRGVDLMIGLDCSRSMLAQDVKPDRLARAKREIHDLVGMIKGDRVGLVAFAGTAFMQCPLTLDYGALNLFLNSLTPDYLPVGGTDLAGAIDVSMDSFDFKQDTDKAIILITDGEPTIGETMEAAKRAAEKGVRIFCIGVGTSAGAPIPAKNGGFAKDDSGNIVVTKPDTALLEKISALTDGRFVRSEAGDMDLKRIYTGDILGRMNAKQLKSGKIKVMYDRSGWFFGLAAFLLFLEMVMPSARRVLPLVALCLLFVPGRAMAGVDDGFKAYDAQDYERALAEFTKAEQRIPDDPRLSMALGNTLYKLGRFDEASQYFVKAQKAQDKGLKQKALYNLGNCAYRMGKADQALKLYDQALRIDPKDRESELNKKFIEQQKQNQQNKQDQNSGQGDENKNKDKKGQDQKDQGQDNKDKSGQNKQDKQDQDNQGQDDKDKDQNKDGQNQQDKKDDKNQSGQNDKDQDQSGENNKQDQGQDQGNGQNQQSPQQQQQEQQDQQSQGNSPAGASPSEQNAAQSPDMATRALNRLEDKPGKALMPGGGNRRTGRIGRERCLDWHQRYRGEQSQSAL